MKPYEQVADAEALFDITSGFVKSVKKQKKYDGVTPSEFGLWSARNLYTGQMVDLVPWCLPNIAERHNQWKGLFGRLGWEGNFHNLWAKLGCAFILIRIG
ncbi:hypothetical protein SOVF_133050 [Spinacia oleracea]|nr:hypothetical protein SOVF_133050 [Spinacia oleracea]